MAKIETFTVSSPFKPTTYTELAMSQMTQAVVNIDGQVGTVYCITKGDYSREWDITLRNHVGDNLNPVRFIG
jgi:hypothetical protein